MDDIEAIKQLKGRYCRTMDTKDWAAMRQVLTGDVVIDMADSGIWAMEDVLRWPDGSEVHGYGHYHETYDTLSDGWRIKTPTLTWLRTDVTAAGLNLKVG